MTVDIEAIARSERCDASSLRIALPLLEQGYLPPFLARYRRDELGGIGESPLWSLLDALRTEQRLQQRREELLQRCRESGVADDAFQRVIHDARSQRVLDRVARRLRHEPSDPAQQLAARLLSPQRDDPGDLAALAEQIVGAEAVEVATAGLERALTTRLNNDPRLMRAAVRWLGKHAKLKILEVADPHVDESESRGSTSQQTVSAQAASKQTTQSDAKQDQVSASSETNKTDAADVPLPAEGAPAEAESSTPPASSPDQAAAAPSAADTGTGTDTPPSATPPVADDAKAQASAAETPAAQTPAAQTPPAETPPAQTAPQSDSAVDPAKAENASEQAAAEQTPPNQASPPVSEPSSEAPKAAKGEGAKASKAPAKPKKKKISPRQRRRRWLVSVLQPLKGKTITPNKLTAFQTVMLGRALRSEVVQCSFQYDAGELLQQLLKTAEGFNPSRADQLRTIVTENEAKLREAAEAAWWDELVDGAAVRLVRVAADQLRQQMLREPIDARVILSIDAIGPKTAAVAIVAADGRLLHTEDVPCQLSAAVRQQTVTRLGELVHQFHADLIVVSNGPARRASLVVLSELLEQSQPGSLRWTMAERSGADLYANGPAGNREMRSTPRRFRAATWLGFQAISPAQALIKVEPTKLRLGSFQRELADDALAEALGDVLVSGVSNDGVDTNRADQAWLTRLPGMSESVAEAVHRRRRKQLFASRNELNELSEWPDEVARNQAIGFLRVFQSEQPLDGTLIHPNDYALAEKLAKSLEIPLPPAMPPGYEPPSYDQAEASGDEAKEKASDSAGPTSPTESADAEAPAAVTEDTKPATEETPATADSDASATATSEETPVDASKETAAEESAPSSEAAAPPTEATPPAATAPAPDATSPVDGESAETTSASDQDQDSSTDEETAPVDADAATDVSELKSFREATREAKADSEASPAPPDVPEPYRHPRPEQEKVARLAKEWQIGPQRAQQIVNWLCDPFTSGSSPVIAAPAAVMQRVPKLAELKPGDRVSGVVVGVAPFGVFVELGPDCNGLIHVSRLSESYVEDLHEAVQVGDVVVAWVTGVDTKRRRVALSAVSPEREAELAEQRKQRRGDGRRGGAPRPGGQRSGQRGPASGGKRGPAAGGKSPAGGRRRDQQHRDRGRDSKRGDQGPRTYTKVSKSKAAPPPITEAMQKGDEPLRTFGDLMQFFQQGKEEKKAAKPKEAKPDEAKPSEDGPSASEAPTSVTPAKQGDSSEAPPPLPSGGETKETETPADDATVEASRENESPQNR